MVAEILRSKWQSDRTKPILIRDILCNLMYILDLDNMYNGKVYQGLGKDLITTRSFRRQMQTKAHDPGACLSCILCLFQNSRVCKRKMCGMVSSMQWSRYWGTFLGPWQLLRDLPLGSCLPSIAQRWGTMDP